MLTVTSTLTAQQAAQLSAKQSAIQRKAATLKPDDKISVIPMRGVEQFGRFVSSDASGFTFYDVDRHHQMTLQYIEVKKLRKGYAGYNFIRGQHTDPLHNTVAALIIGGVLAGLIIAAATAKD
jgi:hypothetical protein